MNTLTASEREHLTSMLDRREKVLRDEIRAGLKRMRTEGYEDLLSGTSDAGDESLASLMTDITNAEVVRDATELKDILAANARLTDGTYGLCIDCDAPIAYARLVAYPTAKRCVACQQIHEEKRSPARRT